MSETFNNDSSKPEQPLSSEQNADNTKIAISWWKPRDQML